MARAIVSVRIDVPITVTARDNPEEGLIEVERDWEIPYDSEVIQGIYEAADLAVAEQLDAVDVADAVAKAWGR